MLTLKSYVISQYLALWPSSCHKNYAYWTLLYSLWLSNRLIIGLSQASFLKLPHTLLFFGFFCLVREVLVLTNHCGCMEECVYRKRTHSDTVRCMNSDTCKHRNSLGYECFFHWRSYRSVEEADLLYRSLWVIQ